MPIPKTIKGKRVEPAPLDASDNAIAEALQEAHVKRQERVRWARYYERQRELGAFDDPSPWDDWG